MYKILFAALLMCSTAAFAEEPKGPPPGDGGGAQMEREARPQMSFEERKKKALERIAKHKAKLAEKEACVNAAADGEALKACFPHHKRGEGGGWGGKRRGGGGEDGPGGRGPGGPGGED